MEGWKGKIVEEACREHGLTICGDCFYIYENEEYNKEDIIYKECKIGRYTYGYESLLFDYPLASYVRRYTSINYTARIWSNHPMNCVTTHPFRKNREIIIGNDVWIGTNAILLPGIKIGDGAIVAVGAVVIKDVDAYAVVGGVPAKVIKFRFKKEEIDLLEKIKCWDWTTEEIKRDIELFY